MANVRIKYIQILNVFQLALMLEMHLVIKGLQTKNVRVVCYYKFSRLFSNIPSRKSWIHPVK